MWRFLRYGIILDNAMLSICWCCMQLQCTTVQKCVGRKQFARTMCALPRQLPHLVPREVSTKPDGMLAVLWLLTGLPQFLRRSGTFSKWLEHEMYAADCGSGQTCNTAGVCVIPFPPGIGPCQSTGQAAVWCKKCMLPDYTPAVKHRIFDHLLVLSIHLGCLRHAKHLLPAAAHLSHTSPVAKHLLM